ncbi:alanine/glycine:cation symporter family protein [Brachyspira murdochii]|uniref:Amino acid carrier protein n=1 Tax=Brachyspira murdochii (strain ATCC 51284 / DSM 12563 / 56-150) TaxID=526224 RepID=D5UA11_BRAM5|nr:alanine/glycine:cation symporter family protein [Brachyspira murdochii]ADG71534.1 amino acid carrier protein [Brachyspira murdochii DSM 12563]
MDIINNIITSVNNVMYGYLLLIVFLVVSIFFTFRLRAIQISHSIHALKLLLSTHEKGDGVSGFASFCISTASRVGTGNITGVMAAVSAGGPGALFWMWLMAILGGSLAFTESTLAQLYKEKDSQGKFIGGASFYIKSKLKKPILAAVFAVCMIFTYTTFNGMQANTISGALSKYNISVTITAVILTVITGLILFSKRRDTITHACVFIVPVMAIPYILIGLYIFVANLPSVPSVFQTIFVQAFKPSAFFGGAIGTTISNGLKRGLFSNEAGMGGAPHAAAAAHSSHPCKQGLIQMFSVFTDTILICSISGFILLLSPEAMKAIKDMEGINLFQYAMESHLGSFGSYFITVCILFFSYSSILGNFFYIKTGAFALKDSIVSYIIVGAMTVIMVFAGSLADFKTIWGAGDMFMGFMALLNIIVIVILNKPVYLLTKHYVSKLKYHKDPVFNKNSIEELSNDDAVTQWNENIQ